MSAEITLNQGRAEMAFTGNRKNIWHGLGQELSENASMETWQKEAGMNWSAMSSPISYKSLGGDDIIADGKKMLYRSDNNLQLGIVGDEYKVVQPGDVLQFFEDLTKMHGMKLSTAGTLFGGRKFWALAEVGKKADITANDEVTGYLLLTTSVDGTMSTQARFTSVRVVCNNTLNVALTSNSKKFVKITHRRAWDPKQVKIDLGILSNSWDKYISGLKMLSRIPVNEQQTRQFYEKMFYKSGVTAEEQGIGEIKLVNDLVAKSFTGIGSEMSAGTAWGALNGATEVFTHWKGNREPSRQFWDSFVGDQAERKEIIFSELVSQFDRRMAVA